MAKIEINPTPVTNVPKKDILSAKHLVALAVILVLCLGAWGYYTIQLKQSIAVIAEAQQLAFSGDFASAIQRLAGASNSPDANVRMKARGLMKVATFLEGENPDRIAAVRMIKEEYPQASNHEKALLLNYFFSFFSASREPALVNEVFTGAPFEQYRVVGDDDLSIKKLAELSLSLHPTSESYLQDATWHAVQILSRNTTISKDMKKEHADMILADIGNAQALYTEEAKTFDAQFALVEPMRYYSRLGYLYGVAAIVYPENLAKSEQSYAEMYIRYTTTRDAEGKPIPLLATWLPHAMYKNALFVYYSAGESRYSDVRERLEQLVAVIEENPAIHRSVFLSYMATVRARGDNSVAYKEMVAMANVAPKFKTFLDANGWDLK